MFLNLANKLTICRVLFVPIFVIIILRYSPDQDYFRFIALWIFLFAVILDILDGYVARKFHQKTKLGAILDPLVDKILLISAFICLYKIGAFFDNIQFPIWLVAVVICRDVILVLGAITIRVVKGNIEINPTIWGKMTTFFEVCAVIGILLQWRFSAVFWYCVLVLAIGSGIDYIVKGIKEINHRIKI